MTQSRTSAAKLSIVTIPVVLGLGFLMGLLSNSGFGNDWFDRLAKPAAMPPGWAFGAAWTILYVLLGWSLALAFAAPASRSRTVGLGLFLLQLVLNFTWSPLFFGAHQVRIALAVIAAILLLSIAAGFVLRKVNALAAGLMIPYIGWLCFASYLNFEILRLNPGV